MIKIVKKIAVGKLEQEYFSNHQWVVRDSDGTFNPVDYLYNDFKDKLVKITIEDIGNGED